MTTTLASTLETARDSLTPENWRKGSHFVFEDEKLCMCAHGAIQKLVNPICRKFFPETKRVDAGDFFARTLPRAPKTGHAARTAWCEYPPNMSKKTIWDKRPFWVQDETIFGNLDAHFLLGMVGLTTGFNDASATTLDMVKRKFDEAIALARELGV